MKKLVIAFIAAATLGGSLMAVNSAVALGGVGTGSCFPNSPGCGTGVGTGH